MSVYRGDVVIVDFPFPDATGSKVRPALVVQSDRNNGRIANTVVAMITRRTRKATSEPTQVLVSALAHATALEAVLPNSRAPFRALSGFSLTLTSTS